MRAVGAASRLRLAALCLLALSLLVFSVASRAQVAPVVTDWASERSPNHGLDIACEYEGRFEPRAACRTTPQPRVLVWGDSMAMQFVPGLARGEVGASGMLQATMSACGPIVGVSPLYTGRYGEAWARKCLDFNDSVIAWLLGQPAITHVVLSGILDYYVEPGQKLLTRQGTRAQGLPVAQEYLRTTLARLQAAGKTVVILAPPPSSGFDAGACNERLLTGRSIGRRIHCDVDRQTYEYDHREVIALLRSSGAKVLWPSDLLCDARRCLTQLDGVSLYRDKAHFSVRGSVRFAERFGLSDKVLR
jgi:hypothetical protein